ncbi:MAG: ABC transporter substrate-binding protein [Dehalococcoidia bacterium]|nr:ABC transporter substrate-binding protein [Dehalococcoidia bacterium]
MKGKRFLMAIGVLFLALIVAALPFVSACAPPPEAAPEAPEAEEAPPAPKPEEQPLLIAMNNPLTGPAAELGIPHQYGTLDGFRYVNEVLGGVNGHPIEVIWHDNAYDTGKAIDIYKSDVASGALLEINCASHTSLPVKELAERDKFPVLTHQVSPGCLHPPGHLYGFSIDHGDSFAGFLSWVAQNWKEERAPRVAMHGLDNPTGWGAVDAGKAVAEDLGIDIVAQEFHKTDTVTEMESLTRIKALNPDFLYLATTDAPAAIIAKDATRLGMRETTSICNGRAACGSTFVEIAGADVAEGIMGVLGSVVPGMDVPGMAAIEEYGAEWHPDVWENQYYIYCWASALMVSEALRVALENVGYDGLTPETVETQGIRKIKGFSTGGLTGSVDMDEYDRRLSKAALIIKVSDGVWTPISDWIQAPAIHYEEYDWFE